MALQTQLIVWIRILVFIELVPVERTVLAPAEDAPSSIEEKLWMMFSQFPWYTLNLEVKNAKSLFFFKFLVDTSPFCGATDTPILDFWWRLLWVSKPEWVLPYSSLAEMYVLHYTFPEIHLWCDTCQPLGSQHGSQAISSTYLQGMPKLTEFNFVQSDLSIIACDNIEKILQSSLGYMQPPNNTKSHWMYIGIHI